MNNYATIKWSVRKEVSMFKKLTDFSYKRTKVQALGFYIAYFVLTVIVSGLVGGILGLVIPNPSFESGVRIGTFIAIIFSVGLSFFVLKKKRLQDFKLIVITILSGVLALFGGGLLGLIPAAYLSTLSKK